MPSLRIATLHLNGLIKRALSVSSTNSEVLVKSILDEIEHEFDSYRRILDDKLATALDTTAFEADFFRIDGEVGNAKQHLLSLLKPTIEDKSPSISEQSNAENTIAEVLRQQCDLIRELKLNREVPRPQPHYNQVKLPQIQIPTFSGNLKDWVTFRDLFEATIDSNSHLSGVQKFQYLRSLVSGEAASILNSIPLSENNYQVAWDALMSRYERPYLIVRAIIQDFINVETVSPNLNNFSSVVNSFSEGLEILKTQGSYANSKDPWLIYLISNKLDKETNKAWAEYSASINEPSLDFFLSFLSERRSALEIFHSNSNSTNTFNLNNQSKVKQFSRSEKPHFRTNTVTATFKCIFCHDDHSIHKCQKFSKLNLQAREKFISNSSRCYNCFGKGHSLRECKSTHNCSLCSKRHHTLLHKVENSHGNPSQSNSKEPALPVNFENSTNANCSDSSNPDRFSVFSTQHDSSLILPTVVVSIRNIHDKLVNVRALLDTGSQPSLISESILRKLGLKRTQSRVPITCLDSNKPTHSRGKIDLTVHSRNGKEKVFVTAHVLPNLIKNLPQSDVTLTSPHIIKSRFDLADPEFEKSSEIQMILGSSVVFEILGGEKRLDNIDQLYLQESKFGWVVCSKDTSSATEFSTNHFRIDSPDESADKLLEKFWALEEPPNFPPPQNFDETQCETLFKKSVSRLSSGRFSVSLPFRSNRPKLGSSYGQALRRFYSLEKRLASDSNLKSEYIKFMSEYESLGHMQPANINISSLNSEYYVIPHHPIWQQGPKGYKLRVVFDASAKTDNGVSLNEVLHVGPTLQNDITNVINYFRNHRFVITGDIEKMYRQILINPDDWKFQIILWRASKDRPIKPYFLKTVTYGQACSPYLSLRTVQELINQEGGDYPRASEILTNGRYVDDIFFGHDDPLELRKIRLELSTLLQKGGLILKKWATNLPTLLDDISQDELANPLVFTSNDDFSMKTLGISWHPSSDAFSFQYSLSEIAQWSKRSLLSESARIYDPMGWVSPVTVKFKFLFQETWIRQLDWDTTLPPDIVEEWRKLRSQLAILRSIKLNRFFGPGQTELFGFADASQRAYAAVVYLRRVSPNGDVMTSLLFSKTKLSPIKQISIPRLELCAAHLLARVISHFHSCIPNVTNVELFSDSTTVLAWIKSNPKKWSTFVGNRIGHIRDLCPRFRWSYIQSKENPSDLASRGCYPSQITSSNLWWHGPSFLMDPLFSSNSLQHETFSTSEEEAPLRVNIVSSLPDFWVSFSERFSKFNRLIRSLSYIIRFTKNSRKITIPSSTLTAEETKFASNFIISKIQHAYFSNEITSLKSGKHFSKNSKVRSLTPFLDENGLLRVGGRLQQVSLDKFNPQPYLLPKCHFSDMLIRKTHLENCHCGPKLISSIVRQTFWIIGLQKSSKSLVNSCARCVRYKASTFTPSMGNLPTDRVTPSKPFSITGLDFAGPISLRPYKNRGNLTTKGYIAVFVCFSTKALHLELIMNLSVTSLLMGLHRFISRRGKVDKIISDNGRNFLGCSNALKNLKIEIGNLLDSSDVKDFLATSFIEWHFIPPYTPHFGGLWEAGVRSVKHHLSRMFNSSVLTIEEMHTALCQIESILNSRPLTPLSFTDTHVPITPAHLLTGEPIATVPDFNKNVDTSSDVKTRQECIENIVNGFWQRWREDFIFSLMKKPKWTSDSPGPSLDDIVFIKRPFDPPKTWLMGKVTALFPGPDKRVRVVDVLTHKGVKREAVRNLVPLAIDVMRQSGGNMNA